MKKLGDLGPRVAVAVIGIPAVLAALWFGGWVLGGLMAWAAAVGAVEFYRMVEAGGGRPFKRAGAGVAAGLVLVATQYPTIATFAPPALGVLVISVGLFFGLAMFRRWPEGAPMNAVSTTLGGILYIGLPLAFVPMLRALPELQGTLPELSGALGPAAAMSLVLLPLLTTWMGDASAYFVGHAIGKNKLAPKVSPGKTLEGSAGGLIGAIFASVLITHFWINSHPAIEISLGFAAGIGVVLAIVTQFGDLVESLLKREAGIKDSGTIFPGHGGMLDRLDALLWAFPATWLMLWLAGVVA